MWPSLTSAWRVLSSSSDATSPYVPVANRRLCVISYARRATLGPPMSAPWSMWMCTCCAPLRPAVCGSCVNGRLRTAITEFWLGLERTVRGLRVPLPGALLRLGGAAVSSVRDRVLMTLLMATGARVGKLCGAHVFDWDGSQLRLGGERLG